MSCLFGLLWIAGTAMGENVNWTVNPYDYQYDMTVYVALSVDGVPTDSISPYTIGAFYGEECRGVVKEDSVKGKIYGYLRVRSNQSEGEKITFRIYNPKTGKVARCDSSLTFRSMAVTGLPSSPYVVEARNPYKATFTADGFIVGQDYFFGDTIFSPVPPEKEGYTFGGWSDVPKVMPSHDLKITGEYTVNVYAVNYYVDGKWYHTDSLAFNKPVVPLANPVREGYQFSGWSEIPDVMPAHDVTVTGSFVLSGIEITVETAEDVKVYDLKGRLLLEGTTLRNALERLPHGIYIINGRCVRI